MDWEAAGFLDGLEDGEREARIRLLDRLCNDGFDLDELRDAAEEDRLALLAVERVLGGTYTASEVEERTGLSADVLMRLRRTLGLPPAGEDDRVFGDQDIEMAQATRRFIDAGLGERAIGDMTRVLGESMARVTATAAAAFVEAFLRPGDTEYDVATRFASLAEEFVPAVHPILITAFDAHLREAVRRGMIGRAEREAGALADAQELSVCFADLVGFTRMGVQVDAQDLGGVAGRLAELASDVTEAPVRLIKTIGDAAMFVSPEPAPIVRVALELVEAMKQADLPSLRAGIAHGPTLLRAGDYYGHTVNLASRVTGIARPDSVLCTQDIRDAAADDFDWSFAGKHRLKGVGDSVPLFRARLPGADSGGDGNARRRSKRAARS
jgi:adenylate cyclase